MAHDWTSFLLKIIRPSGKFTRLFFLLPVQAHCIINPPTYLKKNLDGFIVLDPKFPLIEANVFDVFLPYYSHTAWSLSTLMVSYCQHDKMSYVVKHQTLSSLPKNMKLQFFPH